MDDARALLDSLMGAHRNVDRKEAKRRKGTNFLEDNICKHYLVGFCPQYEELFHSTKRDIGTCHKVHSEAMKTEFEEHPERKKYQAEYERRLRQYLDDLIRSADDWATRERRNIKAENQAIEDAGPNELAKMEIKQLKDAAQAFLEEAETLAEASRLEESKAKVDLATEMKRKASEYEERALKLRTEDVCEICGSRMESGDAQFAKFRHIDGKIHLGYLRIREFLAELTRREQGREKELPPRGSSRSGRRRSRSGRRPRADPRRERDSDRRSRREERDSDRRGDSGYRGRSELGGVSRDSFGSR